MPILLHAMLFAFLLDFFRLQVPVHIPILSAQISRHLTTFHFSFFLTGIYLYSPMLGQKFSVFS